MSDESGAALLECDGELKRVRKLQGVTQPQAGGKHRDISVDFANPPTRILGDRPPISLSQSVSLRF